ncbi:50S ribosomal protein L32 [Myceligenerans salitolerans]|uniref:Large ribosomal subunit protein bL32 n=1 Tax=Myceligenerans salitolerans TaxID=1230528 RepID=A0ABS3I4Z7_9MICO|nr:50S ribosomal protein L32 [Myceligenerans salitolerans]MBO0608089.1 50S ribosomal protein L32 [Myceligenerans salitolerans]
MAVPKRKMSRSRTRSRRAQWTTSLPALVPVATPDGSVVRVPRRLARAARRGVL